MTDERKAFVNAMLWVRALNNAYAWEKNIAKFKSELIESEQGTPEIQGMDYTNWEQIVFVETENNNGEGWGLQVSEAPTYNEFIIGIDVLFFNNRVNEKFKIVASYLRGLYAVQKGQLKRELKIYRDDLLVFLQLILDKVGYDKAVYDLHQYLLDSKVKQGMLYFNTDEQIHNFVFCLTQVVRVISSHDEHGRSVSLQLFSFFKYGVKPIKPMSTVFSARGLCTFYNQIELVRRNDGELLSRIVYQDFHRALCLENGDTNFHLDRSNKSTSKKLADKIKLALKSLT